MRLHKFIANAGVTSRRNAENLIIQGKVRVNGILITNLGAKVSSTDIVEIDGKKINVDEEKIYIMLHKPVGYITSVKDQFTRPTVIDLVKDIKKRIYPVGRLDYDTSGLLLLTNDGDFAFKLTHPSHEIKKVYIAEIKGIPSKKNIKLFKQGIKIDDYITSPSDLIILSQSEHFSSVKITIHEGKNRQVRKMLKKIGHETLSLKRIAIGNIRLTDLEVGKWRSLKPDEIKYLKYFDYS